MSRVIRRIEYSSRSIHFAGTAVFHSMGKYVTDFLVQFQRPPWRVTALTEADVSDEHPMPAPALEMWQQEIHKLRDLGHYVQHSLGLPPNLAEQLWDIADNLSSLIPSPQTARIPDVIQAYVDAMTMPGYWCRQCGEKQMPGQDQIPHTAACFVRRFLEII